MSIVDDAIAIARQQHPRGAAAVLADEVESLRNKQYHHQGDLREIASLRSRLAETTGQLDAANKHVEILQASAVENYNVWCEQMAALREAARKALRLTEYADMSDDCQYGTLDTTLVRDLLADLRRLLGESHE